LPTSALNRENVSQILIERGIPESSVKSLLALLDECEFAKYSPASARKEMQEVYDEGAEVIDNLETEFAKASKTKATTPKTEEDEII
ncbi:MAG: hypothetical protein K2J05_02500, partial [Muribaculaceae bacterium]|nr:hypothetical protein [Muribaculaceae bacterium]